VFEIGGGSGSNARHILDYVAAADPAVYAHMSYTVLDISDALTTRQRVAVGAAHADSGVFKSACVDATQWGLHAATPRYEGPCVVLGLEVLDNLPHDKLVRRPVRRDGDGGGSSGRAGTAAWSEVHVCHDGDGGVREEPCTLRDEWASLAVTLGMTDRSVSDASIIHGQHLSRLQRGVLALSKALGRVPRSQPLPHPPLLPRATLTADDHDDAVFVPTGGAAL
jgi:hypothetical protein